MNFLDKIRKSTVVLLNSCFALFNYNIIDLVNRKERFYLENGIEVICIQNANFKKSVLNLIIDAGSIYNPESHPGLAHLVEHMIFHSSKKYPEIYGMNNYVDGHSGYINGLTSDDKMKFTVRIGDKRLLKIADMLANALAEPLFDKEKCENEIEIIEHEYIMHRSDFRNNFFSILKNNIDAKHQEHLFNCGNRATLKRNDIVEKIKSFKNDYFTANRMKLVITSKMNADELKQIANLFKIIPKGRLENGFDSEKSLEIPFNAKYEIKTLNTPLKNFGFNSEASGSIVSFYSKNELIIVSTLVPGEFCFLKFKFDSYLHHALEFAWETYVNLLFGDLSIPSKKIQVKTKISKRFSLLTFEINCKNADQNTVNLALQQLHTFLHSFKPNLFLSKFLSNSLKEHFEEPVNEMEIAEAYDDLLFYNIEKDLKSHLSSFPFDEEVFKRFFEYIADIDNWFVLIATGDKTNLTEREPWYFTKVSKPVKINLINNYSRDVEKKEVLVKKIANTKLKSIKYTWQFKKFPLGLKKKKKIESQIVQKKQIFHKEFDFGEYTAVNLKLKKEKPVKVSIDFFTNPSYNYSIEQDLWNSMYLQLVAEVQNKMPFNCIISVENNKVTFSDKSFKSIFYSIKLFKSLLDEPLPWNKMEKFKVYLFEMNANNLKKSINEQLNTILNYVVKTDNLSICYRYRYPESYYVDITVFGKNSSSYADKCYELIKSTVQKKENMPVFDKLFKIKIFDEKEEKSIVFAFDLGKNFNGKQFGMALILRAIYTGRILKLLRHENQLCYRIQVDTKIIKNRSFLIIHVITTSNQEMIEEILQKEFLSYPEFINEIQNDHFKSIKEEIKHDIDIMFSNTKDIQKSISLAKSLGIYSFNCQEILEKTFEKINKKDLLDLCLQDFDPIILKET